MFPEAADCWYLTGPTAVGKTAVAMQLAQRLGAEIISLDSMAIYRQMDIGTAKPAPELRAQIPHHLLDIVDPDEDYSLSMYVDAALACIAEIRQRGREVLFVGGTPLYLKSLLRGIFSGPPADWEFRRQVEEEARQVGIEALHERLQLVDPLSAAKLHPNDIRRIIRALEVYRATGQPISHLQMQFDEGRRAEQCRVFVLNRDRAELHRRIDDRVAQMLQGGLVDEVRRLRQRERPMSHTAAQAVGYREVGEYLDRKFDAVEMERRLRVRTHQFARRQLTWFRGLSECRWVGLTPESDAAEIAHQIASSPDPNQAANDRAHNGPND